MTKVFGATFCFLIKKAVNTFMLNFLLLNSWKIYCQRNKNFFFVLPYPLFWEIKYIMIFYFIKFCCTNLFRIHSREILHLSENITGMDVHILLQGLMNGNNTGLWTQFWVFLIFLTSQLDLFCYNICIGAIFDNAFGVIPSILQMSYKRSNTSPLLLICWNLSAWYTYGSVIQKFAPPPRHLHKSHASSRASPGYWIGCAALPMFGFCVWFRTFRS